MKLNHTPALTQTRPALLAIKRISLSSTVFSTLLVLSTGLQDTHDAEAATATSSWITITDNGDPVMENLTIPADAAVKGMWSSTFPWPMNGLHSILLPNGKVLTYGTSADGNTQDGRTMDIWDSALGFGANSHNTTFGANRVNSFCGAATFLGNGQLMVSGGNTPLDNGLFTPADGSISTSAFRMAHDRWYPTLLNLPDGRPLIIGGMVPYSEGMVSDPVGAINAGLASMTPELFDPATGWQSLFGATSRDAFGPDYLRTSYPRAWVAPNGKVFGISSETMWYLDPTGNGAINIVGKFKGPADATTKPNVGATNTAVMFAPGKILQVGGNGYFNGDGYPSSAAATVIDINGNTPVLTEQPPMNFPRRYGNAIVLADGKVVITGGTKQGNNGGTDAVYAAELWNPATGKWSVGASAKQIRVYHSISALLPNGSILSTGGGTPGPVTNLNAEIYYPPYLFQSVNGVSQLATRPVVDAISSLTFANGANLQLDMVGNNPVSQLILLGTSAGTHSFNSSQRRIPLNFTQNGVQLSATIPNANLVPPGYYQVVAVNTTGVPSKGVIIGIGQIAQPNMPVALANNSKVSLSPLNATGQVIGIDANGLAISQTLSAAPSAQELAATTFTVRPGNAAPNCVSFEYTAKPGQFLRHYGYRLMVNTSDGSALFNEDSTFCPEVGLSNLGGVSLRSHNYASNLLRNRNGQIWIDPTDNTVAFNDSASFVVKVPSTAVQIPSIAAPIVTSGATVNYAPTISSPGAQFSWNFGDGSAATAFNTSPATSHQFSQSGLYLVTLTLRMADGSTQTKNFVQAVVAPTTAKAPTASSAITLEKQSTGSRLWVVNPDNDSVSVFNTATNALVAEIAVGTGPRSVAVAPNGNIWVSNKDASSVSIINPTTLAVSQTIALPRASQPHGLAFAPDGSAAYVVLEATGQLLKLDPTTGAQIAALAIGSNPRQLSIDANSSRILVSRFITPPLPGESTAAVDTSSAGGEVVAVNPSTMTLTTTVKLKHSDKTDNEIQGSGIPNYLGAAVISPDGQSAWVPSKQDNIKRGILRNNLALDFQNTVRAISSRIDLGTMAEDYPARIDHDNSSLASAASYDATGAYLFVALETARQVEVVNAINGKALYRIEVGIAPQALTVSADGTRLYVQNYMDRSVSVIDITALTKNGEFKSNLVTTATSIKTEKLPSTVLKGKQLFFDARDPRLARDSYLSCASCHSEAGHDGRIWDFTGFGEGLRNTIPLKGRSGTGQGFMHWSANFDEVQDFEGQIRNFAGGTGLMTDAQFNTGTTNQSLGTKKAGVSADLDALAAYLGSLKSFNNSPFRAADASLTSAASAGKKVFQTANCTSCHSGYGFTVSADASAIKNIGTIKASSGKRLGATLTGIDVPTLRDVWSSAPYLHDGSASTLAASIQAHQGNTVAGADLDNLVAYLQQIGQEEAGTLGLWSFNEGTGSTAADSSGANHPLKLANTTWVAGKLGQAAQFNGNNAMAESNVPVVDTAGSFSVAAWVRLDALTGWRTMVNQDGNNVSGFWLQYSEYVGNKFLLTMHDSDSTNSTPFRAVSTTTPVIGQWYHVVGVRDKAAGTMKLYVNGKLEGTTPYTGGWTATGGLNVGRGKWGGPNDWFAGGIDEVQTFGTALADAEIAQLYAQGNGPVPVNNIAPSVAITAPSANALFTQASPITLTANASDSDGTIAKVDFYDGSTLIGSDSSAPYQLSWSNAATGIHSLTAKALDNAGASTTSPAVAIQVNTNQALTASLATSYVSTWEKLSAVNNNITPANSADKTGGAYGNWQGTSFYGRTDWVSFAWPTAKTLSAFEVYWWNDGLGIATPTAANVEYWNGTAWAPVAKIGLALNTFNRINFSAITTTRIRVSMKSARATGILEARAFGY